MAVATGTALLLGLGASAAVSGYSAYKQGKAADKAAEQVQQTSDWQKELASQQWERYLDTFAPLEDKLVEEAQAPVEQQPGFSRMMGTIDRGYSDTGANLRRMMGGRYPSGSGLEVNSQLTNELNRTRTKTQAYGAASESRFDRMLQAAGLGRGIPTTVMNTAGNVGSQYGNLANMYGNAAAGTWNSMGNTAGNLMQMYLLSKGGGYPGAGSYGVTPSANSYWNTWH